MQLLFCQQRPSDPISVKTISNTTQATEQEGSGFPTQPALHGPGSSCQKAAQLWYRARNREIGRARAQQGFNVHSYCVAVWPAPHTLLKLSVEVPESAASWGDHSFSSTSPLHLLKARKLSVLPDTSSMPLRDVIIPDFVQSD